MHSRSRVRRGYQAVSVLSRMISREMAAALAHAPAVVIVPENTDAGRQVCRDWPAAIGDQARIIPLPESVETLRGLRVVQMEGRKAAFQGIVGELFS